MFIVFLFTLIFTVFTACNYNICLFCSYLHWYSLYLLLVTIIVIYRVLFTLIFTLFTAFNYNRCLLCPYLHWYSLYLLLVTIIYVYFVPIILHIVFLFTLIFTVFTDITLYLLLCNYNRCLFCSYLHWYSLYLLLATIIVVYCVPIYNDIRCIYCL